VIRDREELRAAGYLVRIAVSNGRGGSREIDAISFKGLLALAHDAGLKSTSTEVVQFPTDENRWTTVVRATIALASGTFTGIGDANPENVNPEVAQHAVRVCETRALARALRVALNVGEVSLEEFDRFQWVNARDRNDPHAATTERRGEERARDEQRPRPPAENGRQAAAQPPPRVPSADNRPQRFRGRDSRPTERRPDDSRLAMSDTQRKLLFRLAYDLVDRNRAAAFLLERLGVERFEWATRADASRLIDELRADATERNAIQDDGRGNGAAPAGEASHG